MKMKGGTKVEANKTEAKVDEAEENWRRNGKD